MSRSQQPARPLDALRSASFHAWIFLPVYESVLLMSCSKAPAIGTAASGCFVVFVVVVVASAAAASTDDDDEPSGHAAACFSLEQAARRS